MRERKGFVYQWEGKSRRHHGREEGEENTNERTDVKKIKKMQKKSENETTMQKLPTHSNVTSK